MYAIVSVEFHITNNPVVFSVLLKSIRVQLHILFTIVITMQ